MSKAKANAKTAARVDATTRYKFRAEDFWKLIQGQEYKCALSGRELTPENTEVELKDPAKLEGRGEPDNLYLLIRPLAQMARYTEEREIVELAAAIIETRGEEFGYGLKKTRSRK
ncbi:MAG: hypothetical protein NXI24_14080 [bacterium]|nr:hypothetical protein [bacterium]